MEFGNATNLVNAVCTYYILLPEIMQERCNIVINQCLSNGKTLFTLIKIYKRHFNGIKRNNGNVYGIDVISIHYTQ